uniref:Uncharacterized protein n=1 Tax=Caenorhabditis japonica TaxID=281687 RepID=A0A8R1I9F3_CAEJA
MVYDRSGIAARHDGQTRSAELNAMRSSPYLFVLTESGSVWTESGRENAEVSSIDDSGNNEFFGESIIRK